MSIARIGSYHQSGGGIGSIILSAFFFTTSSFPFLYLRGSWGNHEGNRKRVSGKEEPTMKRAMVNILFVVLAIAAELFLDSMKKSKKASK